MDPPLLVAELSGTHIKEEHTKESAVRAAVVSGDRSALVRLARSKGGLLSDDLRILACE